MLNFFKALSGELLFKFEELLFVIGPVGSKTNPLTSIAPATVSIKTTVINFPSIFIT